MTRIGILFTDLKGVVDLLPLSLLTDLDIRELSKFVWILCTWLTLHVLKKPKLSLFDIFFKTLFEPETNFLFSMYLLRVHGQFCIWSEISSEDDYFVS